jgi:hypothetical protein
MTNCEISSFFLLLGRIEERQMRENGDILENKHTRRKMQGSWGR